MSEKSDRQKYVLRKQEIADSAFTFKHPLGGETSQVTMTQLASALGMTKVGVNIARTPPGKEAFVYHRHLAEEEWVYILEGRARSEIEGMQEDVEEGDFLVYPPGVAHNLINIGDTDLVCLMGSDKASVEIAEFPKHNKRLLRAGDRAEFMDEDAVTAFIPEIDEASSNKP